MLERFGGSRSEPQNPSLKHPFPPAPGDFPFFLAYFVLDWTATLAILFDFSALCILQQRLLRRFTKVTQTLQGWTFFWQISHRLVDPPYDTLWALQIALLGPFRLERKIMYRFLIDIFVEHALNNTFCRSFPKQKAIPNKNVPSLAKVTVYCNLTAWNRYWLLVITPGTFTAGGFG